MRGHHPKIAQAVEALRREARLPCHLRPVERDRRILGWLKANGYAADLSSRSAIARHFEPADATRTNRAKRSVHSISEGVT
jgi:hypothetical protein